MDSQTQANKGGLDGRAILAGVAPVAWFVAIVVLAALGGYPGAACVTPLAWLIGLAAGQRVAAVTTSPPPRRPLVEAALAGALIGLIEGVLFALVMGQAELTGPDEARQAAAISLGVVLLGVPATAGLAVLTAWLALRRRGA